MRRGHAAGGEVHSSTPNPSGVTGAELSDVAAGGPRACPSTWCHKEKPRSSRRPSALGTPRAGRWARRPFRGGSAACEAGRRARGGAELSGRKAAGAAAAAPRPGLPMEAAPDPGPRLCCKPGGRLDMSHGFVHHIRRNQLARYRPPRRPSPSPARPGRP